MNNEINSTIDFDRAAISPEIIADRTPPSNCSRLEYSSALDLADRLISDRSTSFWLVAALNRAMSRDIVDAVNDAELLLSVLTARLEEINAGGAK